MVRKLIRDVNGYTAIYLPDYPRSWKKGNWKGWVYEHVVIAEQDIGRSLYEHEVVHHLDFNRSNNKSSNLLVLTKSHHSRLHKWLDTGAPGWQQPGVNWENSGKSKSSELTHCIRCNTHLQDKQIKYCSQQCHQLSNRKVERPSSEILQKDITSMNWETIAKKYGVSSNAIRKWARSYNLIRQS